jgi:DNA-binding NtrC family response regulator
LLIDRLLDQVNHEAAREQPGYRQKKLSAAAKNLLLNHGWPGNVRELLNTLQRAALWSDDQIIDDVAIKKSLLRLPHTASQQDALLGQSFDEGFSLPKVLNDVGRHYIERALKEAHGNRTRAAALLGLASYQTLNNWIERYGVST